MPSLSFYGEYQMAILYSYPEVWLLVNSQNGLNAKTLNCNKGPPYRMELRSNTVVEARDERGVVAAGQQ